MRRQSGHLLPLTEAEIERIWNEGTPSEMPVGLVQALHKFKGRIWLSLLMASEFVRNRACAASAIGEEPADTAGDMKGLESAFKKRTDDLRGRRPLRPEVARRLKADVDAVIRTAAHGLSFGVPNPLEVTMAERLVERVPGLEMVRMVNSGTEATMAAIRDRKSVV